MQNMEWYTLLIKPALTPPAQAFLIVWPVLYALMAVAFLKVWFAKDGQRKRALTYFFIQLGLNLSWSPVFFGLKSPAGALIVLFFLLFFLFKTTALFYKISKTAGILLFPYAVWGLFAVYLNAGIVVLN